MSSFALVTRLVKLRLLLLSVIPLFWTGCQSDSQQALKGIQFNPVLRRDLQALSNDQMNLRLSPFYASDDQTLNELYPVPAGLDDQQLREVLRTLKRSNFYYSAPGEAFRVSWEVVGELDPESVENCNYYRVGGCSVNFLSDPETRDSLVCDDQYISVPDWSTSLNPSIEIRKSYLTPDEERAQDPFAPLTHFSQPSTIAATSCANPMQNYPFCQMDCELPASAGTFSLTVNASETFTTTKVLKPTILAPSSTVTIYRRLTAFTPTRSPTTPGFRTMLWTTEKQSDETWLENYSPSFSISRIRVMARNSPGNDPRAVEVGELNLFKEQDGAEDNQLRTHTCARDTGLQEFSPRTCQVLGEATPTYLKTERSIKSFWRIEVPEARADGSRNFEEADQLFIEFTLAAPSSGVQGGLTAASSSLIAQPTSISVGAIPPNVESRFENRVLLVNTSDRPLTLRRFRISSLMNGQVSVDLPGRRSLPFTIYPGTLIPVTLRVTPDPTNGVSRTVFFKYDDGDVNSPHEGQFGVGGRTYRNDFYVTPSELHFEPGEQKVILAMNSGPAPLTITSAVFQGVSRTSFKLVNPAQFPLTLNGFTHQRVYIQYEPTMIGGLASPGGGQSATLEMISDGGNKTLTLRGAPELPKGGKKKTVKTIIAEKPKRWGFF